MTRLDRQSRLVCETGAFLKQRPLVVELSAQIMHIRPKGAHWGYDVDYESIFALGARKTAEKERAERVGRKQRTRYSR